MGVGARYVTFLSNILDIIVSFLLIGEASYSLAIVFIMFCYVALYSFNSKNRMGYISFIEGNFLTGEDLKIFPSPTIVISKERSKFFSST